MITCLHCCYVFLKSISANCNDIVSRNMNNFLNLLLTLGHGQAGTLRVAHAPLAPGRHSPAACAARWCPCGLRAARRGRRARQVAGAAGACYPAGPCGCEPAGLREPRTLGRSARGGGRRAPGRRAQAADGEPQGGDGANRRGYPAGRRTRARRKATTGVRATAPR